MLISASDLKTKIALYKRLVSSVKGVSSVSYEFYKNKMSDWRQVTSRELMRSNIEYTLDIYTVRIRLDKNINTSFQVHYKNRVYNVTSVVHDENVQSTILTVQAGVAK
jgi:phage head-tail adaptor, putative, SPP1 family